MPKSRVRKTQNQQKKVTTTIGVRNKLFKCNQLFFEMGAQGLQNDPNFNLHRFKALHKTMEYMCSITKISPDVCNYLAEKIYEKYESNLQ